MCIYVYILYSICTVHMYRMYIYVYVQNEHTHLFTRPFKDAKQHPTPIIQAPAPATILPRQPRRMRVRMHTLGTAMRSNTTRRPIPSCIADNNPRTAPPQELQHAQRVNSMRSVAH